MTQVRRFVRFDIGTLHQVTTDGRIGDEITGADEVTLQPEGEEQLWFACTQCGTELGQTLDPSGTEILTGTDYPLRPGYRGD
ncbi:MAG: hypothetical protein WCP21_17105 [Armatimonadota bacterium]